MSQSENGHNRPVFVGDRLFKTKNMAARFLRVSIPTLNSILEEKHNYFSGYKLGIHYAIMNNEGVFVRPKGIGLPPKSHGAEDCKDGLQKEKGRVDCATSDT